MTGPRRNLRFDIAARHDIVLRRLRMGHTGRILRADRAIIQIGRDIVRRRPDQLHTAFKRLLAGLAPLKRGKSNGEC